MVKISVIMPVYNDEEYLSYAIDSIVNQTLDDIELICVNDGSTDDSLDILNDYANRFDYIKVFTKENEGSGIARNFALEKSSGEYIAYLDSDDIFVDKDALRLMYDCAIKNDADMVSGNLKGIALTGELVNNKNLKRFESDGVISPEEYGIPYSYYKNIFKKEFLVKNNLEFPDLLRGQDPVFLAEILTLLDEIPTVAVDLYGFRYSKRSDLLKMNTYRKRYDYIKHFKDTFDILDRANFNQMRKDYEDKLFHFIKAFHNRYTKEVKDIAYDIFKDDENVLKELDEIFINPNVSVILACGDERYLKDSISSVLKQSLKKIELICVVKDENDVLNEFSLKDSRIRIIEKDYDSLSKAKNIALTHATGDYVYFLNSNDKIKRNTLKLSYKTAFKNKSDIVAFKADTFDENQIRDIETFSNYDGVLSKDEFINFSYDDVKKEVLEDTYTLGSKLYEREFLNSINLKFDETYEFEDILFQVKAIMQAKNVSFVNRRLFHLRLNVQYYSNYMDIFKVIDSVEEFLINKGLFNEFKEEFHSFTLSLILHYILEADSEEYFKTAKETFKNNGEEHIDDSYLSNSYELALNSFSFKEFKPVFETLKLENDLSKYKKLFNEVVNVNSKLKNRNIQLKKENSDYLNSTSWKITKPFRKLTNFK